MRSGPLRHVLEVLEPYDQPDAAGQPFRDWRVCRTVRAQRTQTSASEFTSAAQRHARAATTFRIRALPPGQTINPDCRLRCDGVVYELRGAIDSRGTGEFLDLACEEFREPTP